MFSWIRLWCLLRGAEVAYFELTRRVFGRFLTSLELRDFSALFIGVYNDKISIFDR